MLLSASVETFGVSCMGVFITCFKNYLLQVFLIFLLFWLEIGQILPNMHLKRPKLPFKRPKTYQNPYPHCLTSPLSLSTFWNFHPFFFLKKKKKKKKKNKNFFFFFFFFFCSIPPDSEDKDVKEDELYISLTVLFVLDLLNCILFILIFNT